MIQDIRYSKLVYGTTTTTDKPGIIADDGG
jgi:hypothetical protein